MNEPTLGALLYAQFQLLTNDQLVWVMKAAQQILNKRITEDGEPPVQHR